MSNLLLTLIIAFVVIALAIACLAIGWLITGKSKIAPGSCGRNPEKKEEDSCNPSGCGLCRSDEDKPPKNKG